jgi:hydrogenase nickel incorporation protein HypA/HybF
MGDVMHELGICEAVLGHVRSRAAGRRVDGIGLLAGAGLRLNPEAMQQSFELLMAGTSLEGAELDLDIVPGRGRCRDCGARFDAEALAPACPSCSSPAVDVEGGEDLIVTWLRFAEADAGVAADAGTGGR